MDRVREEGDEGAHRPSSQLLVDSLLDPRELTQIAPEVAAPATRVASALSTVRDLDAKGDDAEQVLWELWRDSGLADRLLRASAAGGRRGAAAGSKRMNNDREIRRLCG